MEERDFIHIRGGKRLSGVVSPQGSKNAALPIIAAAMLVDGQVCLSNVPQIKDVEVLCELLSCFGAKIIQSGNTMYVNSQGLHSAEVPKELSCKIRSSSYLLGCLLPLINKLKLPLTGGCSIGARPLDIHVDAAEKLGVIYDEHTMELSWENRIPADIRLRYPSVGATINTIMLACNVKGRTAIHNSAREPEAVAVADFLNKCGAKIIGAGGKTIIVEGGTRLCAKDYVIPFDRIVCGDILLAVAATGGTCEIRGVENVQIMPLIAKMSKSSCKIKLVGDRIYLESVGRLCGSISTAPYPGFPTDLQAQFTCACAASGGRAIINENVFGSRFAYSQSLQLMGARLCTEGRRLNLDVSHLHGECVYAPDLRGGAALIIAGLATPDNTKVGNISVIDRGYENLCALYTLLGGDITRS